MFIKKFDWLSPPITLYFKGENQHASIISAVLSIICYVLVFASGIYYALGFVNKKNPKAYFFNRYVVDAGYFPVNSSLMFNFIQICDQMTNEAIPFDFTVFRVVGFDDVYSDEYMNNPDILNNKNHWIYGNCNNNSDTEGIGYLVDFKYYEQSACIRKYYDKDKKKYYNTGDPEFKWPIIEKGCSNPDRTYYGIVIQRCDKSPEILKNQGPECLSEEEITNFISKVSLKYQIIDHYADMLDYEMPFTKYFYEVTSAITNGVYIINHLNFNPANMLTHNGFFFDHQVEERSYFFTQNEKHTIDQSILSPGQTTNGCLIGIYFWMQNTLQYYERNYDRFQDFLSDIGGVSSIVVTIGYYLNLLIHNYVIVLDTQELVLARDHENYYKGRDLKRKPTIFRKANEIDDIQKKIKEKLIINEIKKQSSSSGFQKFIKNDTENIKNNKINKQMDNNNINIYVNRKTILKNNKDYNKTASSSQTKRHHSVLFSGIGLNNFNSRNSSKDIQIENKKSTIFSFKDDLIKDNNDDSENRPLEKKEFNWFKYIWYLICCGTNDKKISYYEDFRSKLISEENIIQNYLDIYKLLKKNNLQKINI
jgi:hypothetical protein